MESRRRPSLISLGNSRRIHSGGGIVNHLLLQVKAQVEAAGIDRSQPTRLLLVPLQAEMRVLGATEA